METLTASSQALRIEDHTDVYFLRSQKILQEMGLNPMAKAQIFVRRGPGVVAGITRVVDIIASLAPEVRVSGLREGASYAPGETLLVLDGPIQSLIVLETVILGVLSSSLTICNDRMDLDLHEITRRTRKIKELIGTRPLVYFGARHWSWKMDGAIAAAVVAGGAAGASTKVGAAMAGTAPVGTIPHALEAIFSWRDGPARAVVASTIAFDRVMPSSIPRVALVDYRNREVDDAIMTAEALGSRLSGIRIDTCGENIPQGGHPVSDRPYHGGSGVTISGVSAVRDALDEAGFEHVKVILSSGFGSPAKVRAFVEAELEHGRLFDGLGVGGLYPARVATMDVVQVEGLDVAKSGRTYCANRRLELLHQN